MKCLVCDREAATRGLCRRCYKTAGELVRRRQVTWKMLIEHGLATETKSNNPFIAALAKISKKKANNG